jgi:hypothetical protein
MPSPIENNFLAAQYDRAFKLQLVVSYRRKMPYSKGCLCFRYSAIHALSTVAAIDPRDVMYGIPPRTFPWDRAL